MSVCVGVHARVCGWVMCVCTCVGDMVYVSVCGYIFSTL